LPQHLSETRLTTDGARDREPAWSPDGSKIAFTKSVQGNNDIYVMSADGFSWKSWPPATRAKQVPSGRPTAPASPIA
jgi:Tol biopolymer transport system component